MRTFNQMLAAIRKTDEALREAVSETAAYIMLQYHKNGRKADGAGLPYRAQFVAALPDWLQKEAAKWALDSGKRIAEMSEREAAMRADAFVGTAFASQEDKRRIAKENREARKALKTAAGAEQVESKGVDTPEAPEASQEATDAPEGLELLRNALITNEGDMIELTMEESAELVQILMGMRGAITLLRAA